MANGDNANVTLAQIRNNTAFFRLDNATYSAEIKAVQKALYFYGYCPGGTPDGYYGAATVAAVKGFQHMNGLTVDGYFGKSSLEKLEEWAGTISGTRTTVATLNQVRKGLDYFRTGDTGASILTIRRCLNEKGYTCASTGSFDSTLAAVVKTFQRNMGLTADGYVGQGTLAVLEDTTANNAWISSSGYVNLTPGKLARAGFTNILLRQDIVTQLNNALNYYGINTRAKVRHFLAQCMAETDYGKALVEYTYRPGTTGSDSYAPFYGAGLFHLSWRDNYVEFYNEKGDTRIISPDVYATQYVAIRYPAASACHFWKETRKLDSIINWNDSHLNICTALTKKIHGESSTDYNRRYQFYLKIADVLV